MIVALVLLAARFQSPALELELAGGLAHSLEGNDGSTYDYPLASPAVQVRAAIDFVPGAALGGVFLAVVGGEAPNSSGPYSNSGNQAFSATATLLTFRLRSSGVVQFWGEAGVGTGHLISLQTDNSFEHPPLRGTAERAKAVAQFSRALANISGRLPALGR